MKNPFRITKKIDQELLNKRREAVKGLKSKMDIERSLSERFADLLTDYFGTVLFFILNAIWFLVWMLANTGLIPGIPVFDPFPYGLLTMVVSLEAIFLAIIVLISQNRAAKIADLREEIMLQVSTLSEQEITKLINMVDEIHDHIGLPAEDDDELIHMKEKTNMDTIESELKMETFHHRK
jgi:uncharacterized membrane protein